MRGLRFGVRGSTTLAATVAVAVILTLAGWALIALLRTELTAGVDSSLVTRADDVAALVRAGSLPAVIPAAQDESSIVQVFDAAGRVVASSGNIQGEAPLARSSSSPIITTTTRLPISGGERFRVRVQPVGDLTLLVARSLGAVDRAVTGAGRLLAEILPVVLLLVALVTWLGVGRALAPLELIRRKTATIGAGDLSQRVPLPSTRDEVYRLAETMNSMLARIAKSTDLQRRFVADASHELRSPLANMQAVLEVAQSRHDLALWEETGVDLRAEQDRMRDLVDDLLLLARLDGHVPLVREEVDLDDLLHDAAESLRRTSALVVVDPVPALRVSGDPAQLARVLRNLADNAQRHARTTVWLSLRRDGDWAMVSVRDDGPGVPVADQQRIFDRFTRLDEARARDRGGSGLGLAISREIAQAHGGSLRLVSAETAAGASFELRLPLWVGDPHQR